MKCPKCDGDNVLVINTGMTENGKLRFRRRECNDCRFRFFTVELPVVDTDEDGMRWWSEVVEEGIRKNSEENSGKLSPCPLCGSAMEISLDPWGLDCSAGCGIRYRPQKRVQFVSSVFAVDGLTHDWNLLMSQSASRVIREFIRNEKERRKPYGRK